MKRRKFADGGKPTEMRPSAKPEGGRFDEDTYSRARRFVESGGEKGETKSAPKPAAKAANKTETSAPSKAEAPKAAERASDTSKRFPSETPASKDDTVKSVSERIKESRERARTSTTGTDTRSVSERIRGSKVDTEEAPAKRAEIPTDSDGPKAPKSTGESTSGPSNVDRVLAATGVGAGAAGLLKLGKRAYDIKRANDAKRAAENMESVRAATNTGGATRAAQLAQADARAKAADQARLPKDIMDMLNKPYKKGGTVKKYASGGSVSSASSRGDGIAQRGKTKGKVC